ncbi:hypothetical protein N7509_008158 [Penicillium cosmopolitanum]|uniref:Tautomerase cis-CaaD-like domain-containing protein n=1 Tax=Penicillium cosmopolitanum TaxID=1131564 RepID=A0A9W9W0A8_9EURO|nr:uncharacterized protein N7509_008158 [Penicillium cosmopolitanum]KAJ5392668.1 hypothetical protein N7509_008158 [Penicillium cosmopolitanum]
MPLWLIFHPAGTFEDEASRHALAQDITKIYTRIGLPAFYVVANFIKLQEGQTWVGGELHTRKPFIRIAIEHIAAHIGDELPDDAHARTNSVIEAALKPHVADKGYDWEFHVDQTDRRLWKVNGFNPPAFRSEAERLWFNENRPVFYEPEAGKRTHAFNHGVEYGSDPGRRLTKFIIGSRKNATL